MPKYAYKAPWGAYPSFGQFKNRKAVTSFIRKIDTRYKRNTTKQLIIKWNIYKH